MPAHFYLDRAGLSTGDTVQLDGERHHYLTKVLRHTAGDLVEAFDGRGQHLQLRLSAVQSRRATATIEQTNAALPPAHPHITLGLSVLKGQAMDRAVQSATELGAAAIQLTFAARSNVSLDPARLEKKLAHWRKLTIAACEQCGRVWLPELNVYPDWASALQAADVPTLVCAQGASRLAAEQLALPAARLLVGPEGGWSPEELANFANLGLGQVSIGEQTLRAESMPVALLSVVEFLRGAL